MAIKEQDVQRHIIHENVKRARINDEEEIVYSEFDGYEISTVHVFAHNRGMWFETPIKEKYQTYRWYGKGGLELSKGRWLRRIF